MFPQAWDSYGREVYDHFKDFDFIKVHEDVERSQRAPQKSRKR
jgi:hypothetical protein